MINTLLWRCPLCAAEEALQHRTPLLRSEQVICPACGARWRVRRVPGSDFCLRLEHGPQITQMAGGGGSTTDEHRWTQIEEGDERPLAEWYDRMKASVRLVPRSSPLLRLADGEALYLVSGPARLEEATLTPAPLPGRERGAAPPINGGVGGGRGKRGGYS